MARRSKKAVGGFNQVAQSLADSLTTEQYCRLVQIACPLSPEEEAKYGAMSDDELLAELLSDTQTNAPRSNTKV